MSKRPPIDLLALTAEQAIPMPEAAQRSASERNPRPKPTMNRADSVGTENLEALAFKVSPVFRRRFRQCAVAADLKLNELLFQALDAWEEKNGTKREK